MSTAVLRDRPIPPIDPVNDGRHQLRNLPLERESIPYVLTLPEAGICAFIYTWVSKDNIAGCAAAVFGPGVGEQPIVEAVDGIDVGPKANFDDWRVGNIVLQQDLKMQKARIAINGPRVSLDAHFEAAHPAYSYASHPEGCPTYAATNRIEQAGRLVGSITVDGRRHAFDTTGARDHSWGSRDWQTPQHWKWLHAQAGTDTVLHFWQINARGRTDLRGFVLRDGRMAEVSAVEVDFDVDSQYRQTRVDCLVQDTAGRSTRVVARPVAVFPLLPGPHTTLNESGLIGEIDGKRCVGWTEFMWPTPYLEHLRNMAAAAQ